ncbi:MaoC/PaaZ C-terminal domain-containing protein [Paraconexibacter sp. AEG42_29]
MRYAEDLTVGTVFELGERQLSAEEIVAFARDWDPQPFHVDPAFAEQTDFGGLIASGVQTIAVAQRLLFDAFFAGTAVIAGVAVDGLRMRRPVRPSTIITGRAEIDEQRLDDDGRGLIGFTVKLVDQDGDTLMTHRTTMLVSRRPTAAYT